MQPADLATFLHTPEWERFLKASGHHVERDGEAVYVKGSLPSGGSYWRASRIAIGQSWTPPAFAQGAWFLRLEPLEDGTAHLARFGKVRPTDSVQPKQTVVIDLSQAEDALLAQMKSKHRYNIRLSERQGVTTEFYHQEAPAQFDRFWKLLTETADRHTFRTHDRAHYLHMLEELAPAGMAHVGFATYEGTDLAGMLFITHAGVTTYLHGGSTQVKKELMAPHLLHWRAMQWAKQSGSHTYDFWGSNAVQTSDGEWEPRANHPSAGTTRFKLGFGGTVVQFPGAFDLVLKPIPYTLYNGIRRIIRRQSNF